MFQKQLQKVLVNEVKLLMMVVCVLSGPVQGSPQPPKYPESGACTIRPVSNSFFGFSLTLVRDS